MSLAICDGILKAFIIICFVCFFSAIVIFILETISDHNTFKKFEKEHPELFKNSP